MKYRHSNGIPLHMRFLSLEENLDINMLSWQNLMKFSYLRERDGS